MKGFDYDRTQRVIVLIGLLVVAGLWAAENAGVLRVAEPTAAAPAAAAASMAVLRTATATTPPPPALILQGVIAGKGGTGGVAILAESGKRPVLVPEGAAFNEQIQVERVLADRVLLRRRGDPAPITLLISPNPGGASDPLGQVQAQAQPAARPVLSADGIPMPPPDTVPPRATEALPASRLPAPVDASGPPPGPGLSGPALRGPVAEGS